MKFLAIAFILIAILAGAAYVGVQSKQPEYFGYGLLAVVFIVFWLAVTGTFTNAE